MVCNLRLLEKQKKYIYFIIFFLVLTIITHKTRLTLLLTSNCRKSGLIKQILPCLLWVCGVHRARLRDLLSLRDGERSSNPF